MKLLLLTSMFLAVAVGSATSTVAAADSIQIPADVQAVRLDTFSALAVAGNAADAELAPISTRVNFYISQAGQSARRIRTVRIAVDDQPGAEFRLEDRQAASLADFDDLRRILRSSLPMGSHRVHAEMSVASGNQREASEALISTDYVLDKQDGPVDLEFRFDPSALIGSRLKVRSWRPDTQVALTVFGVALDTLALPGAATLTYHVGGDLDPALRHVRHLERTGRYDAALIDLLAMDAAKARDAVLPSDYWFEAAHTTRALGLLDRAEAICDELARHAPLAASVATERLALANAFYEQGALDRADQQLQRSRGALPEFRRPDWRYVNGMLLMARGQSTEAATTLGESSSETIDAFRYMSASTDTLHTMAYSRFNLAVAMIRSGDERRGLSWLDLLGRAAPTDAEMFALRDKANLALGWHFLQAKQGRTALGVLGRIRSEGPLSDRALLGMGWAQLAPNGERLPRVQLSELAPRAPDQIGDLPAPLKNSLMRLRVLEPELRGVVGPRSFERDDPPKNHTEGLARALKIWSVLLERDSREPAVIEAMLATAYAQDQLGNASEARRAYADAVGNLRRVRNDLTAESDWIGNGQFISALDSSSVSNDPAAFTGMLDQLHLPPSEDTGALYAALGQYRELSELQLKLQAAEASIRTLGDSAQPARDALTSASQQLAQARDGFAAKLQQIASGQIKTKVATLDNYLKSALLMSARTEEQPVLESRLGSAAGNP